METLKIKGRVEFIDLEEGIWGIVDDEGRKWEVPEMPEQLKFKGAELQIWARAYPEKESIWGRPVEVISFRTLLPAV